MKAARLFILLLAVSLLTAEESTHKYWIYFTAKDRSVLTKNASPAEVTAVTGVSQRALARRAKVGQSSIAAEDLPVDAAHLAALKSRGIDVQNTSRWFNAATAYLTAAQRDAVALLPFVQRVEPVAVFRRIDVPKTDAPPPPLSKAAVNKHSYGSSEVQMNLMNAIAVHNIGISGRGVLVGMLDTGFRWKLHEAMKDMKVIAEYDFIQKDSVTANEGTDRSDQDSHGTSCMSLVGGYFEGKLVSSAYNAHFILGKTEYVPTETNAEEDNWVAAIEWMEAQGVDVVSSSLGYKGFDLGQKSYFYADMNGKTATTSKAATIAARKGVVVVNAMGNEGSTGIPPTLTSPGDADSIISVGAVTSAGIVASFSSNGPTSDGRTKPDVSTQGVATYATVPSGAYSSNFNGTSAATPLAAGVAAMLLSARPELTPIQVRDAMRNTASMNASPNNTIGWGIVNAYQAVLYHGMVIGTDPEITAGTAGAVNVGIYVVSKSQINTDSVTLHYSLNNGASFTAVPMTITEVIDASTNSGKYTAVIPASAATPKFYVRAVDAENKPRTSPYTSPADLYDAKSGTLIVGPKQGIPSSFVLYPNYPNPFNPSTMISYDVPATGPVTLKVFDLLGREVRTLVQEVQTPRNYSVRFDADGLSSGVYLYRLQLGDRVLSSRMMLRK